MIAYEYLATLKLAAPEVILSLAALLVLGIDLLVLREQNVRDRFLIAGIFAGFGCLGALAWTLGGTGRLSLGDGMLISDDLTRCVNAAILVLTLFTVVLSISSRFTTHVGEYLALILLTTVGMLFIVSSEELLTLFVALELTSLGLYILTAFSKSSLRSAEAALKYFLFGGMSAAFTLYGLSLIYGLSGSTQLRQIAEALRGQPLSPLLITAMILTIVGFGFKVAAAPFHLWAPDAYQGAPTPSAALIASGSKVASFFLFARILMIGFSGVQGSGQWRHFAPGWVPALATLAALSIILGNLAAIVQSSVKRLLAYSAIAHGGYALLGVASNSSQGIAALFYYVFTYGLTVLGAFGVVSLVEEASGDANLQDFAGLSRRAPLLSGCMLVFMLSLAGIPPLAGFFGKFYLFTAAVGSTQNLGLLWLVILAIGMSAVSLYYYLQVLKQIYVVEVPSPAPLPISWITQIAVVIVAAAVVVLGCAPDLILGRFTEAVGIAGNF